MFGNKVASTVVEQLAAAWQNTKVGSDELASMLIAASHVYAKAASEQSTELVWTGPTTPFVSARRTEQALLQVINSAEQSLFITSFVAYDVSTIVKALNAANGRGVAISMLLELSQEHGGRVHAKVAVADGRICFITSANLTGHAMEKNMEAGMLITGGSIPQLLSGHLQSLVDTKLISQI